MSSTDLLALVAILVALQFSAFGWRIIREIDMGDSGRRTWFPLPDWINVGSMLTVICLVVVFPLSGVGSATLSRTALSVGFVLIAFHPISMAAHYRLWSKSGRSFYTDRGEDYPWLTGQEGFTVVVSLIAASVAGWFTWFGA